MRDSVVLMTSTTSTILPLAGSIPRTSPYHLSREQIEQFDHDGFLILRNWINGNLLRQLQEAATRMIDRGIELHRLPDFSEINGDKDYVFAKRENGKEVFFRINYLYTKEEEVMIALLGSPQVLGLAESMNGYNFVPAYESMVFKMPGDGEAVHWHQDAWQERGFRVWNFDLYLDASKRSNGCLRVIPGSQKVKHNACEAAAKYGWEHKDITFVEMDPGDVLLHDTMILHGSPRVQGSDAIRRTIYLEFRSVEQIEAEGPWDRYWVDQRLQLVPVALDAFPRKSPGDLKFHWKVDPTYRPVELPVEDTVLKVKHYTHSPGAYCSANSLPDNVKRPVA